MEKSTETYQTVLLVPQNEWLEVQQRLKSLEQSTNLQTNSTDTSDHDDFNTIIKYDKAAEYLGIDVRSLVRAGNQGRIKRLKDGGVGYSYRMSELKRYKQDKGRNKESE